MKVKRFLDTIGPIELTWLEAAVLLHHYYRNLDLGDVADIVNRHINDIEAARDTLVKKVAVRLGYVTAEEVGVVVQDLLSPAEARQKEILKLRDHGFTHKEIAERVGLSVSGVRHYLYSK